MADRIEPFTDLECHARIGSLLDYEHWEVNIVWDKEAVDPIVDVIGPVAGAIDQELTVWCGKPELRQVWVFKERDSMEAVVTIYERNSTRFINVPVTPQAGKD